MAQYKIAVKTESLKAVHDVEATMNARSNEDVLAIVKELIIQEVSTLESSVKINIQIFKTD